MPVSPDSGGTRELPVVPAWSLCLTVGHFDNLSNTLACQAIQATNLGEAHPASLADDLLIALLQRQRLFETEIHGRQSTRQPLIL